MCSRRRPRQHDGRHGGREFVAGRGEVNGLKKAGAAKKKNQVMDMEALMALGKRLNRRTGRGSYREVLAASLLRSATSAAGW